MKRDVYSCVNDYTRWTIIRIHNYAAIIPITAAGNYMPKKEERVARWRDRLDDTFGPLRQTSTFRNRFPSFVVPDDELSTLLHGRGCAPEVYVILPAAAANFAISNGSDGATARREGRNEGGGRNWPRNVLPDRNRLLETLSKL